MHIKYTYKIKMGLIRVRRVCDPRPGSGLLRVLDPKHGSGLVHWTQMHVKPTHTLGPRPACAGFKPRPLVVLT